MDTIRTLIALTVGMLIFSCDGEQPSFQEEADVVVDFDYEISGDCSTPALEIILENKTANAESYSWDFGDGTTSNQVNPKKVYAKSGEYMIKLSAYFSGDTMQIEKQIAIIRNSDGTGPIGQLSFTRSNATNLELSFDIATEEASYSLSFGDGSTIVSNEKVIKHRYAGTGTYTALLIMQNNEGCNCAQVTIDLTP